MKDGRAEPRVPYENTLILAGSPHVVVGIGSQLEDVRLLECLFFCSITILRTVLHENCIRVGRHILVRIEGDERMGSKPGVNGVLKKAFSQASDDDVVGYSGE